MKSEQKIIVGFVAIVVIFVIFGVGIFLNEKLVETSTLYFSDHIVPELQLLAELKSSTLRVLSSSMEFVLLIDEKIFIEEEEEEEEEELRLISQGKSNFEKALASLAVSAHDKPDELARYEELKEKWESFIHSSEKLIEAKQKGIRGGEILELKEQLEKTEFNLLAIIDNLEERELVEVDEQTHVIQSAFDVSFQFIVIGIMGVILASLISGKVISNRIKNDQSTISKQLQELKNTDKQKNEFISTLSHELRTPLIPIKGTCDILLDKDFPEEISKEVKLQIQSIVSNSKRLDILIDKLLLVQRLELEKYIYKMENIQVKEYVDEIYTSYYNIMSKSKIELVNSIKDTNLVVYGDKNALHEIFSNLLNNAISYVPKENARIEIGADKKDGSIEFFVKDNGEGIPSNQQKKIFNKLYQVDSSESRRHGGLGLGLAICKKLVETMNGKILVKSEVGMGSTFYFSLKTGEKK